MTVGDYPREILSILVFGSVARGDNDQMSDMDIAVFVDDIEFQKLLETKSRIASLFEGAEATVFTRSIVDWMAQYGSLFLWHLQAEAKIVFDRDEFARKVFSRLKPFDEYESEIEVYDDILLQIDPSTPNEFDLHILHMIVRNLCILICYRLRQPTFGRTSAFHQVRKLSPKFPLSQEIFQKLTAWHLEYMRGSSEAGQRLPPDSVFKEMVESIRECIGFSRKVCCASAASKN